VRHEDLGESVLKCTRMEIIATASKRFRRPESPLV
jgi:hypothetical protein